MRDPVNKERKKALEPSRVDYATNKLLENGFMPTYEDGQKIEFMHNGCKVTLFPYTGWFSGKSVRDGRGINNLLKQLKNNER